MKKTLYCSFENNPLKTNPFDPDLIMQNPKYDVFEIMQDDDSILEQILEKYISNYQTNKISLNYYWFEDNWASQKQAIEQAIRTFINSQD